MISQIVLYLICYQTAWAGDDDGDDGDDDLDFLFAGL